MSEAVGFGLVASHMETSESKVVVLRVKGVEALCSASHVAGVAVVFFASFGDVTFVPQLEMDLASHGAIVAKGKSEELDRADNVVLGGSALEGHLANMLGIDLIVTDREATA